MIELECGAGVGPPDCVGTDLEIGEVVASNGPVVSSNGADRHCAVAVGEVDVDVDVGSALAWLGIGLAFVWLND